MPQVYQRHTEVFALEREFTALWQELDAVMQREARLRQQTPGVPGSSAGNVPGAPASSPGGGSAFAYRFMHMGG